MSIADRPYIGTWRMNRSVVRYTPDAIVYINGHTEVASCMSCGQTLDFNKYITTISTDPSTEPVTTASLSLTMPKHSASVFSHDGNYVLRPGLEVVIYMRGYFPTTGFAEEGQDPTGAIDDPSKIPVYPYYQVFRGVVTEATHEFSGGFYSASLTCASVMHFWQFQYIATNGAVFGKRPDNAGVGPNLEGHTFTGMSPYAIMYTLMRVGFGAAFGVNWSISQTTNIDAVDDGSGQSLYMHAAKYWERLWQNSSMRLRMYGFDGSLFNSLEQAYLGLFSSKAGNTQKFIKSFGITTGNDYNFDSDLDRAVAARKAGWRGTETNAAVLGEKGYKLDALKMQAYTLDMGRIANVNFFDTEYMSKLEIANAVKEITGFEFYQDVDGDIVFKPPFYNLDTRSDPVYCIVDRDLISISENEREPEATYVKGSGGLFGNFTGVLSGEFGTRQGQYADWRLVAQFGYREAAFESHYLSSSKQMFVSAMARLDLANVEMRTAQITIPMRPELRPGYPVWVESVDAYFYIKSMSHSFAVGGQCTTTITGCAKRAKFLPPGLPGKEGTLPKLSDVHLDAPGEYPRMPLYVFPEDIEVNDPQAGSSGPPRIQGYPNVVMALDPLKVNLQTFPGGVLSSSDSYFDTALSLGILRRNPESTDESPSYILATSDSTVDGQIVQRSALISAYNSVRETLKESSGRYASGEDDLKESDLVQLGKTISGATTPEFGAIVVAVTRRYQDDIEDSQALQSYMALQTQLKSLFGISTSVAGEFRYFSSSAPDPEDQSPTVIKYSEETQELDTRENPGAPDEDFNAELTVLTQVGDRIKLKAGTPTRGFRIYGLSGGDEDADTSSGAGMSDTVAHVTTKDIRFVTFQRITIQKRIPITGKGTGAAGNLMISFKAFKEQAKQTLKKLATGGNPEDAVAFRFGTTALDPAAGITGYISIFDAITTYGEALGNGAGVNTKATAKYTGIKDTATTAKKALLGAKFVVTGRDADVAPVSGDEGLTALVDGPGVNKLAEWYGGVLAAYLNIIQRNWLGVFKARWGTNGDGSDAYLTALTAVRTARKTLLAYFDGFTEGPSGAVEIVTDEYEELPDYTLVLPVSDNGGYEVYGSFAYGRGMGITEYKNLLEQQGTPTSAASMLATETQFAAMVANPGAKASAAFATLNADVQAQLASDAGMTIEAYGKALDLLEASDDSPAIFVRNTPVTSHNRGMSITESTTIDGLVSLVAEDEGICLCKGVENAHWLQAFTGDFVMLAGEEAVNDFLLDEAAIRGESWTITKEALAGRVLDLRNENKLLQTGEDFVRAYSQAASEAAASFGELKDSQSAEVLGWEDNMAAAQEGLDEFAESLLDSTGLGSDDPYTDDRQVPPEPPPSVPAPTPDKTKFAPPDPTIKKPTE